jgi:hypothetical protein
MRIGSALANSELAKLCAITHTVVLQSRSVSSRKPLTLRQFQLEARRLGAASSTGVNGRNEVTRGGS